MDRLWRPMLPGRIPRECGIGGAAWSHLLKPVVWRKLLTPLSRSLLNRPSLSLVTMVATSITINARTSGWLRSLTFDSIYIFGTLSLATAAGSIVIGQPALFLTVFLLNGWLLGYHHVVSTFTRLTFDSESYRQNRFLIVWLPIFVLGTVTLLS